MTVKCKSYIWDVNRRLQASACEDHRHDRACPALSRSALARRRGFLDVRERQLISSRHRVFSCVFYTLLASLLFSSLPALVSAATVPLISPQTADIASSIGDPGHEDANVKSAVKEPETLEVIGRSYRVTVKPEDTLHTVARRFHTGLEEIKLANPFADTWLPDVEKQITIPAQYVLPAALLAINGAGNETAAGGNTVAIINVPELRLYLSRYGVVTTYPVSVGRAGWPTPFMDARVTQKRVNPSWRPPASIIEAGKEVGEIIAPLYLPGPSNPLGKYAIRLDDSPYLIHGTNKPSGVGLRASHGCIRMYPEHVEVLFGRLSKGDRVVIVNEPVKVGWSGRELLMEVHPVMEELAWDHDQLLEHALQLASSSLVEKNEKDETDEKYAGLLLDAEAIEALVAGMTGLPGVVTRSVEVSAGRLQQSAEQPSKEPGVLEGSSS